MHFVHRAAIWIVLAGVGMIPLSACGDDAGSNRNSLVEKSPMPPKIPNGLRTPGSTVPMGDSDPADDDVDLPGTGGAVGRMPPMKKETGPDSDASDPVDKTTVRLPQKRPGAGGSVTRQKISFPANGTEIVGTLTRPASGERRILVVMLHGYTGDRAEVLIPSVGEGLFERAARRFAEAGIPSFRFDFAGSGESGGSWRNTTFSGQADDTRKVLRYLRERQDFGDTPIVLLGFSQGGLVALKVAASGANVARLALWNPVMDPQRTYSKILGVEQVRDGWRLAQAGKTDTLVGRTRLEAGFFGDIYMTDPVRDAAAFGGPLLIVTGSRDTVAASGPGLARQVRNGRSAPTKVVVVRGDHGFDASRGAKQVDRAIDSTVGFLLTGAGG